MSDDAAIRGREHGGRERDVLDVAAAQLELLRQIGGVDVAIDRSGRRARCRSRCAAGSPRPETETGTVNASRRTNASSRLARRLVARMAMPSYSSIFWSRYEISRLA